MGRISHWRQEVIKLQPNIREEIWASDPDLKSNTIFYWTFIMRSEGLRGPFGHEACGLYQAVESFSSSNVIRKKPRQTWVWNGFSMTAVIPSTKRCKLRLCVIVLVKLLNWRVWKVLVHLEQGHYSMTDTKW